MLLLSGKDFDELFLQCRQEAFHLEVQDSYAVEGESVPFDRFLNGETDDYRWMESWLNMVREIAARGARLRRARVVTEPHTDYVRWSLEVARQNIAAGEEIRYLARDEIDPALLTSDDWWLFDNATVAFTAFEPNGRLAGGAVTHDPRIVALCREVRDTVWGLARPHAEYIDR